jgi:molybdopterin-guanine dinucleotide biosynthesis protein B
MEKIKILNVIGFSGSGKTQFILDAIRQLKDKLNLDVAVIKNIHEHQIDKKGKDSFKFTKAGANYAVTKNILKETTIFLKKEIKVEEIVKWLSQGPFRTKIVFTEGFRDSKYPTILCLKDEGEFKSQMNENVQAISGIITNEKSKGDKIKSVPILNVNKEFEKFLELFEVN